MIEDVRAQNGQALNFTQILHRKTAKPPKIKAAAVASTYITEIFTKKQESPRKPASAKACGDFLFNGSTEKHHKKR